MGERAQSSGRLLRLRTTQHKNGADRFKLLGLSVGYSRSTIRGRARRGPPTAPPGVPSRGDGTSPNVILRASLDAQARLGRFGCSLGISRSGAFDTIARAALRNKR